MNVDTATNQQQLNMVNQNTPQGSLTYTQSGTWADGTPQFTATTQLSPEQQALYDKQNAISSQYADIAGRQLSAAGDAMSKPLDFGATPQAQTYNAQAPQMATMQGNAPQMANAQGNAPQLGNVSLRSDLDFGASPDLTNAGVEQRLVELGERRMLPQQDRDKAALDQQLRNQGLEPGTKAYDDAFARQGEIHNDQRNQLLLMGRGQAFGESMSGRQLSNQERQSVFDAYNQNTLAQQGFNNQTSATQQALDLGRLGFNNQAALQQQDAQLQQLGFNNQAQIQEMEAKLRAQGFNNNEILRFRQQFIDEQLAQRNQPLNEINALRTGAQVANPQFSNTPQAGVANTDYAGLVANNYNQQVAQNNAMWGGLAGIGGAAAQGYMMSDKRLKKGLKQVGKLDDGTPLYSYKYKGGKGGGLTQIGVMAQDVKKKHPNAVKSMDDGMMAVNYSRLADELAKG